VGRLGATHGHARPLTAARGGASGDLDSSEPGPDDGYDEVDAPEDGAGPTADADADAGTDASFDVDSPSGDDIAAGPDDAADAASDAAGGADAGADVPPPWVPPEPGGCNGWLALCDRPYDQVRYATTHNAMSNEDDGWMIPNQHHDVPRQLADGVRGLMRDVHADQDDVYLCHGVCLLGSQLLVEGLAEIRAFVHSH